MPLRLRFHLGAVSFYFSHFLFYFFSNISSPVLTASLRSQHGFFTQVGPLQIFVSHHVRIWPPPRPPVLPSALVFASPMSLRGFHSSLTLSYHCRPCRPTSASTTQRTSLCSRLAHFSLLFSPTPFPLLCACLAPCRLSCD